MTRMDKNELYDRMCHLLTDYETNDLFAEYATEELYEMLVEIQNKWEELTGEDESL